MPVMFSPFPGKAAVFKAIRDAGQWTRLDMFRWSCNNGGNERVFDALHALERAGKVRHYSQTDEHPERWVVVDRAALYDPFRSQIRR